MRASDNTSFFHKLWKSDPAAVGGFRGKGLRALQVATLVVHNFLDHNAPLRAAALTFTTLLSIVPLLALAFALLKGLGAQNTLARLVLEQVSAGSEVVVTRVLTYVNNTNAGSIGVLGLVMLLVTAVSTLGSVEDAFDAVWGVTETRSLYRKFSDYLSVLVSAPLLVLAATSITSSLESKTLVRWLLVNTYFGEVYLRLLRLAPYLSVWIALFLLYIFIPNTKVRYGSAFLGAVLAGTMWEVAQWVYIHFQIGVANYNAIYGTLSALPIVMVWIYTSWLIVLFGIEMVAVHQHLDSLRHELRGRELSQAFRETLSLAALRLIGSAFRNGEPGWGEEQLADRLGVPLRVMRVVLAQLIRAGIIIPTSAPGRPYQPARELDRIYLSEVLLALRRQGAGCAVEGEEEVERLLEQADAALADSLKGVTLKRFVRERERPSDVDKGGSVDI